MPTSLRAAPGLVQHRGEGLLDVVGLAFLDDQHRILALAEAQELVVDQRIGGVEHIERDVGVAVGVGEAEALQRADDAVVHAALHDDADRAVAGPKNSLILRSRMKSTAAGQRFSIFSFSCRKEAGGSTMRPVSRRGDSSASATVIVGRLLSLAMKWPCTWQQRMRTSQHHRRVGGFGKLEAVLAPP